MATKKGKVDKRVKEVKNVVNSSAAGEPITVEAPELNRELSNDLIQEEVSSPEPVYYPVPEPVYDEPVLVSLIVTSYEGCKCRGLFHGYGKAGFVGGHTYTGEFFEGKMHGKGVYRWNDGVIYEGDFENNRINGQGSYTWTDGSTYIGGVLNGMRHGDGTFYSPDGKRRYVGKWQFGKIFGKGRMSYDADGNSYYDGEWENGRKEGYGVRRYPSGNVYEGHWSKDTRHGEGTMHWYTANEEYNGAWSYGIQHGFGEHLWYVSRGDISQYTRRNMYRGDFWKGLRHGCGTYYYANGAVYKGEWMNNFKHGKGKFIFRNGRVYEGTFHNDRIVEHPEFEMNGINTPDVTKIKTRTPLPSERVSGSNIGCGQTCSPSFELNIEHLLAELDSDADTETQQVMNVVLRHITSLHRIYSFYSRIGRTNSTDNTYTLNHLQFSRLLYDSCLLSSGFGITDMNTWIAHSYEHVSKICEPEREILLVEFVHYLIIISFHMHRQLYRGCKNVLANCFSLLMTEYILKRSCFLRGYFFHETKRALTVLQYSCEVYDIYKAIFRPSMPYGNGNTLTMRQFLLLLKDMSLLCNNLTSKSVIDILAADDPRVADSDGIISLEYELSYLAFLEALVGCGEVSVTEDVVRAYYCQDQPAADATNTTELNEQVINECQLEQTEGRDQKEERGSVQVEDQKLLTAESVDKPVGSDNASSRASSKHKIAVTSKDSKKKTKKPGRTSDTPGTDAGTTPQLPSTDVKKEEAGDVKEEKSKSFEAAQTVDCSSPIGEETGSNISPPNESLEPVAAAQADDDEDSEEKRFQFWCNQMYIFFTVKFIPAAKRYLYIQQRMVHRHNHICGC